MQHSFSVEFAEVYGIEKAILMHNMSHWMSENSANKRNFHELD